MNSELQALIDLLDDHDHEVVEHVSRKLYTLGKDVIPQLEMAWEKGDETLQERLELVIHQIQMENTYSEFRDWVRSPKPDVLEGALIIAKTLYPDLKYSRIYEKIKRVKSQAELALRGLVNPLDKIRILNYVLFTRNEFSGIKKNLNDVSYYYLNNVIETGKGNPLSLGIIYLSVAQHFDIPLTGINLPYHFCLGYLKPQPDPANENEMVSFYVNPFNMGMILDKNNIRDYLQKIHSTDNQAFYRPLTNPEITGILLQNLIEIYQNNMELEKVRELNEFLKLL